MSYYCANSYTCPSPSCIVNCHCYSSGSSYCRRSSEVTSKPPMGLIIAVVVSGAIMIIFALITCYLRKKRMQRWAELHQRNQNARNIERSMQMEMQTQSNYADTSYANASSFPMNTGSYPVSGGMYNTGYYQPTYVMPAYQQAQPSYPIYAQPIQPIVAGQPVYAQPPLQTAALDDPGLEKVVL